MDKKKLESKQALDGVRIGLEAESKKQELNLKKEQT
jgi:hypothetical protein